ncbi:MAG: hypothetical protein KUG80_02640 [Gammaproteobacteria bacterium]|nr:hypothetical protein [Gammaproteobacteria bacterium]
MARIPLKQIKTISVSSHINEAKVTGPLKDKPLPLSFTDDAPRVKDYQSGKKHLHISEKRGELFHNCSSMHDDYICCNVKVLATVSNCPYECSYCFLQNYLTDSTLSVVGEIDAMINEIKEKIKLEPWRIYRIGTWELGDSLALEDIAGNTAPLIKEVAQLKNVLLELRTKSDQVDALLELEHKQRTVVSWTMNPQEVVKREEYRTASVAERIAAMEKVVKAGYLVAIHFDPMIYYPDWKNGYTELLTQIFAVVPQEQLTWISIGSLRFNPEMKKVMESNYPGSGATEAEMVLGDDGKVRYIKPLRVEMYQFIYQLIREHAPDPFIYLCMERWDVWKKVMGWQPESTAHHDFLMSESLYKRFPQLEFTPPQREDYEPTFSEKSK